MGNDTLSVDFFKEALELVSDFILIASSSSPLPICRDTAAPADSLSPTQSTKDHIHSHGSNNTQQAEIIFNSILYMSTTLKNHLRYEQQQNIKDAKGACTQIAFAGGTIKEEGVYIFKLRFGQYDETDLICRAYNKLDVLITVLELGPDDGTYEWRHIVPNDYFRKTFSHTPSTVDKFAASKRHNFIDRKHLFEQFQASKRTGKQTLTEPTELLTPGETGQNLLAAVTVYIETNPFTKRDIFAGLIWDYQKINQDRIKFLELVDFFEQAPIMMASLKLQDDRLTFLYANKATAEFCGYDGKIPPGTPVSDIRKDDSKELYDTYIGICKDSRIRNQAVTKELMIPGLAGKMHSVHTICFTLRYDPVTQCGEHGLIVMDKSAQKAAELELERHKNSLENMIRERTIELHEQEKRKYANKNFISGDPSYLVGKLLQSLIVEGPELMEKITVLFGTNKSFILDVKLLDSETWLNLSVGPMNSTTATVVATGNIGTLFFMSSIYITQIYQMSEKLHHALATKSRFLANMSHEVRTPLSGIIGMSRILMESGLTMDQTECAATIQHCGETLLSVINDVLDYTKLEATGMTLDNSELSLHQCLEESLYTVLPAAQKKKLELIIDIDAHIPDKIMGDALRLQQVIVNLLNNAVKFTDTGYIMVSLDGSAIPETEDWKFFVKIKDTGCGVPKELQGRLFQMFSQVDVSTTRRYGGTGIGLALAKRFSEMMNGDIQMSSSGVSGEGCTFFFTLTATLVPFAKIESPSQLGSPQWLVSSTNIFIIEDLPIAAEVLKKRLIGKGFVSIKICPANNVSETFAAIESFITSLGSHDNKNVAVFCNMEKITPLFKYPLLDYPNVALVLMNYTRPKNHETEYPRHEFLRKPIKQSSLVRCLREIWGRFDTKQHQPPVSRDPVTHSVQVYPLNILVVEDNEMNQKVVRRVFQHLGYEPGSIPIANHGKEALEMIEKHGLPDLILMDVQMPVLDGVQTTKIIRRKYPSLKASWPYIVSMTADAFPEDRKNCLDAGMNDFLTKPIRVEQLQTTLQKCYKLKEVEYGATRLTPTSPKNE